MCPFNYPLIMQDLFAGKYSVFLTSVRLAEAFLFKLVFGKEIVFIFVILENTETRNETLCIPLLRNSSIRLSDILLAQGRLSHSRATMQSYVHTIAQSYNHSIRRCKLTDIIETTLAIKAKKFGLRPFQYTLLSIASAAATMDA